MTDAIAGRALISAPTKFGALCTIADSFLVEVLGRSGFDWICIDLQHGMCTEESMVGLLQGIGASGVPALVRVRWNEPGAIMRALDAGAAGVIVPMIEDLQATRAAVAACRYPPAGIRSWGPTRARHLTAAYSAEAADQSVLCAVMVETVLGLENLAEIAAVDGLDCIFVGPSDLALALGKTPRLLDLDPAVSESIERIAAACAANGKAAGIFTNGSREALRWAETGFQLVSVHSDRLLMSERAGQILDEIQSGGSAR